MLEDLRPVDPHQYNSFAEVRASHVLLVHIEKHGQLGKAVASGVLLQEDTAVSTIECKCVGAA